MLAPILHKGLWLTVGHLVHTNATQGGCTGICFTNLIAYRSAIYPQWMTSKNGLGGRLLESGADTRLGSLSLKS